MNAVSTRPGAAIIVAGLIGGAATASGIALTATSGWLIVRASERPVILTLLAAIVAVRAFGMARPYFRYVERIRSHDAALDDLARRRVEVYAGLVPLTPARLGRRARSEVLTGVVDDLTDIVDAQVRVTVPVVSSLFAGLLAVALSALLAPAVGAVLAALLLVIAAGCLVAWRLESRSRDTLLQARAEVMRVSDLVARQATELRAVGGEATALAWLAAAHDRLRGAVARQSAGRSLVAALILVGTAAAAVAAAFLAGGSGVGGPVAALLVVTPVAVGDALAPLVESMRSLARAQGSTARLDALLDQTPAVAGEGVGLLGDERATVGEPGNDDPAYLAPHITLRRVSGSWTGTERQLAPIDLDLHPGRRVAVVGANGCGKSTLLALLARHLDPLDGTYTVDGVDVRDIDLEDLRARFAVVDDEPHVFASTLRENLRLARPGSDDDAVTDALTRAGLGGWLAGLPAGLDTRLGSGGRGLSGGERARLGLARALLSGRPVVLLDEPVAHLDHATAMSVLDDVMTSTADRTVVMVSHRPEGLAGFDDIIDLTPDHPAAKE
jgi:thiol reductant ABC exporter CydC subunit